MKSSRYKLTLTVKELIFIAKVLDQRRFYLKSVFNKGISKDHDSIKRKILNGINSSNAVIIFSGSRREMVYLKNALSQYFIALIRSNIIDDEKNYIKLLSEIILLLDEDLNEVFKGLDDNE